MEGIRPSAETGPQTEIRRINTEHIQRCLLNDHERVALLDGLKLNPNLEEISITLHPNDEIRMQRGESLFVVHRTQVKQG
ncbi:hypothetical protein R1sor_004539 [Riccia sorocarpa]|uniref:Uncharacterized protein n=1 Tax=Riccia sorocarpa TaxID=122646 RepID=A0ABD3HGY7_9MARC